MNIPNVERIYTLTPPRSEHEKELRSLSVPIITKWISEYILDENKDKTTELKISNRDLYDRFKVWLQENVNSKFEIDAFKFAMFINTQKYPGVEKGPRCSAGNTIIINVQTLREHFLKFE